MTTAKLRNSIYVQSFGKYVDGVTIKYFKKGTPQTLFLPHEQAKQDLSTMASIDDESDYDSHEISQWDAICLAVRHESLVEAGNDPVLMDMESAVNNIINPKY